MQDIVYVLCIASRLAHGNVDSPFQTSHNLVNKAVSFIFPHRRVIRYVDVRQYSMNMYAYLITGVGAAKDSDDRHL